MPVLEPELGLGLDSSGLELGLAHTCQGLGLGLGLGTCWIRYRSGHYLLKRH